MTTHAAPKFMDTPIPTGSQGTALQPGTTQAGPALIDVAYLPMSTKYNKLRYKASLPETVEIRIQPDRNRILKFYIREIL